MWQSAEELKWYQGSYKKLQTFFTDFSRTHARNAILQVIIGINICTFQINRFLRLYVTWPSPKADMFLLAPLEETQNL